MALLYIGSGFHPPRNIDVIMIVQKGPGQEVRELYLEGFGTPSLVAVHQDYTKKAWEKTLALVKSIGSTKPGVLETTFREGESRNRLVWEASRFVWWRTRNDSSSHLRH